MRHFSRRFAVLTVLSALLSILKIVTASTVGHSLTLILGTALPLELPVQPIEAAIALSIFVSALHALRPIFPHREVLIAGVSAWFTAWPSRSRSRR